MLLSSYSRLPMKFAIEITYEIIDYSNQGLLIIDTDLPNEKLLAIDV